MIKLTFYGAVRNVTGSKHLLEVNGSRVLLDCGLYQGHRKDTYERNLNFHFQPEKLTSMILSHSHIDHVGNLPNLVKRGFDGDVHCTNATGDLAGIMLRDSARIQEKDTLFVNKIHSRRHEPVVQPLYDSEDVDSALGLLVSHSYDRWFNVAGGVKAMLREAGHILGSAISVMKVNDSGRELCVCFTGDLGRNNLPIIKDPYVVTDADVLIIESTYGERLHRDIGDVEERLAKVINETAALRGKIIVPSFALERTQELVYSLHRLKQQNKIPDIPVFVDSPLAIDATDIFRVHQECFDKQMNELLTQVDDAFGFRRLRYVRDVEESKRLNLLEGPLMIIAASGMAEYGRVVHHLKQAVGNPNNTVLIVGWQAEYTLGRKLADKQPVVSIFGDDYQVRCRIEVFDEFSAHADRNDLIKWVTAAKDRWRKVFIVHGEESASLSLAQALRDAGLPDVIVPELDQSFEI